MSSPSTKRLGKYLLKSKLGQGGMGVVYAALDERLRREVALKVLPKSMAANEEAVRRFVREARAAARINHPNVVSVYDVDQIDGHCFIAMELIGGGSVQELLRDGPIEWRRATRLIADACRGLVAAHALGLIHRDIKPSNLMLTTDGVLKLTDFGLVKDAESSQQTMTRSGSLIGTPQYMSPEQCQGEPVDPRSDLYALGATWFALLTGRAPFAELDPMQAMFAHCSRPLSDPRTVQSDIPAACADVLQTATAKLRVDRFQSASEMLKALMLLLEDPTSTSLAGMSPLPFANAGLLPPATDAETQAERRVGEFSLSTLLSTASFSKAVKLGPQWLMQPRRLAVGTLLVSIVMLGLWFVLGRDDGSTNAGRDAADVRPKSDSAADSPVPLAQNFQQPFALETHWEIESPGDYVRSLCFTADSRRVLSAHYDGVVREWLIGERKSGRTFKHNGAKSKLRAVALSPDDALLVAGGDGKELFVWKLADGTLSQTIDCREGLEALAFRPDSQQLAVGTESSLRVFEKQGERLSELKTLTHSGSSPVGGYMTQGVAYSHDGRWLAATSWDQRTVAIWDAQTFVLKAHRSHLATAPRTVRFSPRESAVAIGLSPSGSSSGGVVWWDFESNAKPRALISNGTTGASLAFTPDARSLLSVGGWGERVALIDLQDSSKNSSTEPIPLETKAIALSPDGRFVATAGGEEHAGGGRVRIWKVIAK